MFTVVVEFFVYFTPRIYISYVDDGIRLKTLVELLKLSCEVTLSKNPVGSLTMPGKAAVLVKLVQSADDKAPRAAADAVGILKVCVATLETILKSVPAVPVAKNCVEVVRPFNEFIKPKELVFTHVPAAVPSDCHTWPAVPVEVIKY